ncbi:hypothetical protein QX233_22775, partial [Chryseobacterium gambrini]
QGYGIHQQDAREDQKRYSKSLGSQKVEKILGSLREALNGLRDLGPNGQLPAERATQFRRWDQEDTVKHGNCRDRQTHKENQGEKEV